MTTTPQIESVLEIGPSSHVGNYEKLVLGSYAGGGKIARRLVSCEVFVITSALGQEHFAKVGANVVANGVPMPSQAILLAAGDVMLDSLLENTLWFKSALTNKNLVFVKLEYINQTNKAINPGGI